MTKEHKLPHVTEIVDTVINKSNFLSPWASKHGTLKLLAILKALESRVGETKEQLVGFIDEKWFKNNKLKKEDFWKTYKDITLESQKQGTEFHKKIQYFLKSRLGLVSTEKIEEEETVTISLDWLDKHNFKVASCEQEIIDTSLGFRGTPDCIVSEYPYSERPLYHIIDWKRTNRLYASSPLQIGGYVKMLDSVSNLLTRINGNGYIVRVYKLPYKAEKDKIFNVSNDTLFNVDLYEFKDKEYGIEELSFTNKYLERLKSLFMIAFEIYKYINYEFPKI